MLKFVVTDTDFSRVGESMFPRSIEHSAKNRKLAEVMIFCPSPQAVAPVRVA
jgi:hypothetical protein